MQFEAYSGLFIPGMIALLALAFSCLWFRQTQNWHILAFAVAFFLISISVFLSPIVLQEITVVTIVASNAAMVGAACCISWALARREETTFPLLAMISVGFIGTTITCWATVSFDHINYQIASNLALFTILFVLTVLPIRRFAFQLEVESLLFWAVLLGAVQLFAVLVSTLIDDGQLEIATFQQTTYWAALNIIGAACALSISISLFAMCVVDAFRDIERQSRTDSLTGVSTRNALFESATTIIDGRDLDSKPLCMIVADLDNFKDINDRFGHVAGDETLRLFGRLLREALPQHGLAGRIGGEEFCVVLPDTNLFSAHKIAEKLRYQFEVGSAALSPTYDPETASFGVVLAEEDDSFDSLFHKCDAFLYEAKRLGRNQVRSQQHMPQLVKVA